MPIYGHNFYTVDEHFPPEGIDFLSDLEIYINSLTTEAPRLDECDIGDMILNLVDVPLVGKKEGRDEESMEMEL